MAAGTYLIGAGGEGGCVTVRKAMMGTTTQLHALRRRQAWQGKVATAGIGTPNPAFPSRAPTTSPTRNRPMTNMDSFSVSALAHDYSWAANRDTIVDVGGGRGSLLAAFLAAAPAAKGPAGRH